jgi:hypothetical protein
MGKSYLYPGSDTEHLSPYQRRLEQLYDQADRPGRRLSPEQFFQSPDYLSFVTTQYGPIPVPPGAQVISQSPTEVRFKDAEGYEHVLARDIAGGREGGQITENTNRPAVLPQQASPEISQALQSITGLTDRLSAPVQLAQLDPQTQAALKAQSDAEQAALQQQFEQQSAAALAGLFGNRVNQSSIATNSIAQLLQQQGLVKQQQQSDAALRGLQLQLGLTEEERNRLNSALAGLSDVAGTGVQLAGQGTQRDIASAGYGVDLKKLQESTRQFNASNSLDALRTQIQQEQLDQSRSPLAKAQQIAGIVGSLSGGVGAGISAYGALTKKQAA